MAASRFAKEGARLLKFGMVKDAGREFERGLAQDPQDRPCLLGLARVRLAARRQDEARPLLERLLALEPRHPETHVHLARLDFLAGDRAAVNRLRALAARREAAFPEFYNLGLTLLELGELDEAGQAFRLAAKAVPESAHAHFNLGKVMRAQGDLPRALRCFKLARQLRPSEVDPYLAILGTLVQQGEIGQAMVAAARAIEQLPDALELYEEQVKLAVFAQAPAVALKAAQELRRRRPADGQPVYLQALALLVAGDLSGAERELEEAARRLPGSVEVQLAQARVIAATGRAKEAEALLGGVLEASPADLSAILELSWMQLQRGAQGEAQALLERSLGAHPDAPGLHLNLALALHLSDPERARHHAEKAITSPDRALREQAERLLQRLGGRQGAKA